MRKLNSLHWPYIGPVVFDEWMQIMAICEMLVICEAFAAAYKFALDFMFELEPEAKSRVRLLFSDCGLNDSFLADVGLSRETVHLFWDQWHLDNKIWPEYCTIFFCHWCTCGPSSFFIC